MAFRVTHDTWLSTEYDRLKQFILIPRLWAVKWEIEMLQKELADIGLHYKPEELKEIIEVLLHEGIIEEI